MHFSIDDWSVSQNLQLIYFQKGSEEWGEPYYITAVETPISELRLRLFPNPSSDKIHIRIPNSNGKFGSGKIFSSTGQCVQILDFSSTETLNIDISKLSRGMYVIQLVTDDMTYGGRFIKE